MPPLLDDFEKTLAALAGRPSTLRPFVCEGSPLCCDVFIVGYNPASHIDGDWWRHWQRGYGFRKSDWLCEYRRQRGQFSKTRKKIEEIVAELSGYRVVETNLDACPSARQRTILKPVTAPFDFLLDACNPRVVIAHGKPAIRHLQKRKVGDHVVEAPHLSRISRERTLLLLTQTWAALKSLQAGNP